MEMARRHQPLHVDFHMGVQDGHHVTGGYLPSGQSCLGEAELLLVHHPLQQTRPLLVDEPNVVVQLLLQVLCQQMGWFECVSIN